MINRDEVIEELAAYIIEGMDYKSLEQYAYESMLNYYNDLSDNDLKEAWFNHFENELDETS